MTASPPLAYTHRLRSFADLGVEDDICQALADGGIAMPFPIQELTLPLALSGADLIGQARTGTGKTLAFGIPLLQRVNVGWPRTQALVVVPTRELCLQVRGDLHDAGSRRGVRVVAAYGGRAIDAQSRVIAQGAPVVVGTPGRLLDLQRRRLLDLSTVSTLILDEADEMLDLGFLPDVERLIEACGEQRQTMLFSATMPSEVVALARRYMHKPTFLRADVEETSIAPETRQYFFSCHRMDKPAVLARILQAPDRGLCLVFTRTKRMADILADELRSRGIAVAPIHSDLRQEARERALGRFRTGKVDVLVATEVAARGLDITDVTHVVNYDCPDDERMYLHRIGRTGRAGAAGVAITLAIWNELARLEMIKRALGVDEQTYEVFSTSPILDELFNLPARPPRADASPTTLEAPPEVKAVGSARRRRRRRGERRAGAATPVSIDDATIEPSAPPTPEIRPGAAPITGAEEPDQAPPPGQESRRRRVRRRTRQGSVPAEEPPTTGQAPSAVERVAPSLVRPGMQPMPSPPGSSQPEPSARERTSERASPESPTTAGEGGAARRSRRRTPKEQGRRTRRQPTSAARREPQTLSVSVARGAGKPLLRRPLHIAHLP
jgi:superfamily II DNA/RNA helicase